MDAISRTRDLVGKTVKYWEFYYISKGRQILSNSEPGRIYTFRLNPEWHSVSLEGLSIPDDLKCVVKKDRVEIDLGDAHVVLQLKEVSDGRIERYL